MGWTVEGGKNETVMRIKKTVSIGGTTDFSDDIEAENVYLVQRGTIKRPLGLYKDCSLGSAVSFDYMGSAEFEFGALPKSFRRIEAQSNMYELHKVESIVGILNGREFTLRIYANFDTEEEKLAYIKKLEALFAGKSYTKESLRVKQIEGSKVAIQDNIDFWWDINNDVFLCFDKQFMTRIGNYLQATFRNLNENAAKA
jgi:hypothetical protein